MKLAILILAICLGFLAFPSWTHCADGPQVPISFVFKPDGTKHCEPFAGVPIDSMALVLMNAGIQVFSSRKGYDGREGIAICGAPTGQINIYEIASSDLPAALSLGFTKLPGNWISEDSGTGRRQVTGPVLRCTPSVEGGNGGHE